MGIEDERRDTRTTDIEELGGRLLAWVGGVAVVAGLALLLAIGISRGWIGEGARTLMAAAVSLALVGGGAWLHDRRGHGQAARAVTAAGIAGCFMTVTVAAAVYALLPAGAGLGLAAGVGALAAALALRWHAPVVAALGIAGSLLAPVLVGAPSDEATLMFEVLAVASAVAVLLRERWDWLMLGTFALSAPQWLSWLAVGRAGAADAVVVMTVFGALYATAALGLELRCPSTPLRPAPAFLLGLNAIVLGVAGWFALDRLAGHTAGVAWLAALAATHLGAGLGTRRSPRISRDVRLLCLVLAIVLTDVAFALTVDGPARAVGFAGVSIGFALVLRRERSTTDDLLNGLGLGGHVALSAIQALHDVDASQLLGPGASATGITSLVAVAAGCLVSARIAEAGRPEWRIVLDVTGLVTLAGIAMLTLDGPALTAAWAAEAVALARVATARRDALARGAAVVHLGMAATFALGDQSLPYGALSSATPLGAAALGLGAVALAAGTCATVFGRRDPAHRSLVTSAGGALLYLASLLAVGLAPAAVAGEVVQQGQLQLSALWSLTGVGLLLAGLARRSRELRLAGFGLLAVTAAKVFLYDLAALTSIWRAASFLGFGVVLLVGALAHQRMRPGHGSVTGAR